MEKQRVKFNLEGWNLQCFEKPGMFDDESEAYQEAIKKREGWLLNVTTKTFTLGDKIIHRPCAVVADSSDGKVYEIPSENIQFIND